MPPVLLGCVGGFLGAGKTTALAAAARELLARGFKVGLVTNDQGRDLVDTAFLRSLGLPTEEVAGGCFCCRFDELVERAGRLVEASAVDVLLAEAVGSCTDLAATVYRPLRRFFGDQFAPAPLSVLVEPDRLLEMEGTAFPDEVAYIFERQIAEADVVILNKIDLLTPPRRLELERALVGRLRDVPLLGISAATGAGVAAWVDRLLGGGAIGEQDVEVDYEAYARGEAALAWLNATLDARGPGAIEPRALGDALLAGLGEGARRQEMALAHAKVLIASSEGSARVAITSAAARPQWSGDAALGPARELSVIVNARAGTAPKLLAAVVRAAVASAGDLLGLELSERHFECFRPPPPVPRHRFPATISERG
jgi:Ni2+-binding GTPase involved in maturation of urease and hydrogenase